MLPHQVVPEFEEGVLSGRFKKTNVAFYADGRLRHVSYSTSMLPDTNFSEDDSFASFDFAQDLADPTGESFVLSVKDLYELTKYV
jgi:hypothetical protein